MYFPENNLTNNVIFYEIKSSFAGHLYYFCTFTRKIMCVLIIVLLKDANQGVKVFLYILVNLIWVAYVILGDPLKTKTIWIVSIINEAGYFLLIIISYATLNDSNSTFTLCIMMILRSALGILMIILWKVLLFATSPGFINTIKPFYLKIVWKDKEIDPDLLSEGEVTRNQTIYSRSTKKFLAIN